MGRISVETVHHPVTESLEITVSVGDLQDLLDHEVPTFDRTVWYSDVVEPDEGIGDLCLSVVKCIWELFKLLYPGDSKLTDDLAEIIKSFQWIIRDGIVVSDIFVIKFSVAYRSSRSSQAVQIYSDYCGSDGFFNFPMLGGKGILLIE